MTMSGVSDRAARPPLMRRLWTRFRMESSPIQAILAVLMFAGIGGPAVGITASLDKTEADAEIARLQTELDGAKKKIAELETTATETATGPTNVTNVTKSDGVYRSTSASGGALTISCRSTIDLDAAPEDPSWGIRDAGRGGDLSYCEPANIDAKLYSAGTGGAEMFAVTGEPSYQSCRSATQRTALRYATTGDQACVLTDEGRWANVRVHSLNKENRAISLDIVVWDKETDHQG